MPRVSQTSVAPQRPRSSVLIVRLLIRPRLRCASAGPHQLKHICRAVPVGAVRLTAVHGHYACSSSYCPSGETLNLNGKFIDLGTGKLPE